MSFLKRKTAPDAEFAEVLAALAELRGRYESLLAEARQMNAPATACRRGRSRSLRLARGLAAAAAAAVVTAELLFFTGVTQPHGPAVCTVAGHSMASGTIILADASGNAWTAGSDVPGPVQEFTCTGGTWTRDGIVSAAGGAR